MFITQHPDEFYRIVVIIQWLSGTHHHQVGYPLPDVFLDTVDLIEHLPRRQISCLSSDRGGTETASHAAADLRGNAHRIAVLVTHQHTLDHIAVRKAEQIFSRSVQFGNQRLYVLKAGIFTGFCQFFPQIF